MGGIKVRSPVNFTIDTREATSFIAFVMNDKPLECVQARVAPIFLCPFFWSGKY